MPKFELVRKHEAVEKAATSSKRGKIMSLYGFFIEQLQDDKAGRLQPSEGETVQAIRRRLGRAANLAGKEITIKTIGDEVYFWIESNEKSTHKRRGRLHKTDS